MAYNREMKGDRLMSKTYRDDGTNLEKLDVEIQNLIDILMRTEPADDEYDKVSKNLKVLMEARKELLAGDKSQAEADAAKAKQEIAEVEVKMTETKAKVIEAELQKYLIENRQMTEEVPLWKKIDPNVVIKGGIALAAVVLVLKHEKFEVIATKAFSFIPRLLC